MLGMGDLSKGGHSMNKYVSDHGKSISVFFDYSVLY